jgi:hypothetical protein
MHARGFTDVRAFAERAAPLLLPREADHCLMLGITAELAVAPQVYPGSNYYAMVEEGGAVLAAALMTPPHPLSVSHLARPEAAAALARHLAASPFRPSGVSGPASAALAFAEAWSALSGAPYQRKIALRIYQLTAVRLPARVPGVLRRATEVDRELLTDWMFGFHTDAFGTADRDSARRAADRWLSSPVRGIYLWEDGVPVAMTGYGGPTPHGMRISAVYTPPDQRRRGYASACVAAVSQLLLDSGRSFCALFTDLANPTSNHIYQEIGYAPVCDVDEYAFATQR